jgi:hypothetical protein
MRITTILLSLSVVASTSVAQKLPGVCGKLSDVTVGQFAEYRVTIPQMGGPMDMRLAIVGTENVEGTSFQWHEMKMDTPQGLMIMQMLVPGFPYESSDIVKMIMKGAGQPAMEMPASMIAMMQQQGGTNFAADIVESCETAEKVGDESITVPAGSFHTEHYRITTPEKAEAWISAVVPFGLVKMNGPEGVSMELLSHGKDAMSSITETPQKMPGLRE